MKSTKRLWRALLKLSTGGAKAPARLVVSVDAQEFIRREVKGFRRDVETGGILMGQFESDSLIRVTHASGPGPNAIHTPSYFLRDTVYCARVLRDHYDRFGVDYVGEWHSHVGKLKRPSGGDLLTLQGIMNDPDYDFQVFAMLLAVGGGKRRSKIGLHGFVATHDKVFGVPVENDRADM